MTNATANLLGAVAAVVIYGSSILTFIARLRGRPRLGTVFGYPLLATGPLLVWLLATAPSLQRGPLYLLQLALMLAWIAVVLVLDYVLKSDFRGNRAAVIAFVVLYFAGTGGMLGVASLAGAGWTIAAAALFLAAGVLAFVQRARTGM